MSGRARGRRVVGVNVATNGGLSLNDRFSQLKSKAGSPATRGARRGGVVARGGAARFSTQMEKRTGRRPTVQGLNKPRRAAQNPLQNRRGGRGAVASGRRGSTRGARGGLRGRGGRGRGRGGKGRKEFVSQDDLDADLDSYMGRSEKVAQQKLDDDLEAYMADRAEPNSEEKKA